MFFCITLNWWGAQLIATMLDQSSLSGFSCSCFSTGWTPLLDSLFCTTFPPTDWHEGTPMPPVYNDRYGYPNYSHNKIWKMPFKWSQKKSSGSIWFKRKNQNAGTQEWPCSVFMKDSLISTFWGCFDHFHILNSQTNLEEIVEFFVHWLLNKQSKTRLFT